MTLLRISRTSIIFSGIYLLGLLLFISFPDPHTPPAAKILSFLFFLGILSLPTVLFGFRIFYKNSASPTSPQEYVLAATALLFPAIWIGLTYFVIQAVKADALGGLSLFIGFALQFLIWMICEICLFFLRRKAS